jgi:Tryptophan halogenase
MLLGEFMNIVVVGGGTAGWLTALFLLKKLEGQHTVTVVESSKLGIIGVGEGTTGYLAGVVTNELWNFGCNQDEFIKETGALIKYAIKHKGWTSNLEDSYIAPIDGSFTFKMLPDLLFAYGLKNLPRKDFHMITPLGYKVKKNLSSFSNSTKSFVNSNYGFHVDGNLVGKYFKKLCMQQDNITHIDCEISTVNLDEQGNISELVSTDGQTIKGDFFLDCSGFAKLLIKHLPNKWISYKENLPVNTAMPFLLPYAENETPESFSTAWAQTCGWMWRTPLLHRKGNGYTFCDAFTTPEKAQEEIATVLGHSIDPIKIIKFESGRLENAWVNNCVAIGLSAAFLEPLEATGIHSVIVQLKNLVFEYIKPTAELTMNKGSIKQYNDRTGRLYDDLRDFLVMHYMGGRTDSEFWRHISSGATKTEFVDTLLEMSKSRLCTYNDFPDYYGNAGWAIYSFVMAGLGHIDPNIAHNEINISAMNKQTNMAQQTEQAFAQLLTNWQEESVDLMPFDKFCKFYQDNLCI